MKLRALTMLILVIVAVSCKKTTNSYSGARVKTLTTNSTSFNNTDTFTYNSDGTIASLAHSIGGSSQYLYTSTTAIEYQYDQTGTLIQSTVWYLNPLGLADSAKIITSGGVHSYEYFSYDGNKYRVMMNLYDGTGTLNCVYTWTIINGNAVTYQYTDNIGNVLGGQNTTFSTGVSNTIGNTNMGQPYLGASSANPPSYAVQNIGGVIHKYNWAYNIDNSSRISTSTQTDTAGNTLSTMIFTYY